MKKVPSSGSEGGDDKTILNQVSSTVEIIYLCNDCYKDKFTEEAQNQIKN